VWYFRTVPVVWYFGTVPVVWYFRTVPVVWYFRTVLVVWYFRTVPVVWYFRTVQVVWYFVSLYLNINNIFPKFKISHSWVRIIFRPWLLHHHKSRRPSRGTPHGHFFTYITFCRLTIFKILLTSTLNNIKQQSRNPFNQRFCEPIIPTIWNTEAKVIVTTTKNMFKTNGDWHLLADDAVQSNGTLTIALFQVIWIWTCNWS
jgi:hypothetical protein